MGNCITRVILGIFLVSWWHLAGARTTPSLTPLTPSQLEEQRQAIADFDRQDWAAALPIFKELAGLGDARSEMDLGRMYFYGWGVTPDEDEAFRLETKAVAQKYGEAEDVFGKMYRNRCNYVEAARWFKQSAEDGDADGEADIGDAYRYGVGIDLDYAQARRWLAASAAQGNARGENSLGTFYITGDGTASSKDYNRALYYFQLAAAQGNADAITNIGSMYLYGYGVPVNFNLAKEFLFRGLKAGCGCAGTDLGYMYRYGLGVQKNDTTAAKYFMMAAQAGNPLGENDIGVMYDFGFGVQQSDARALYWYERSAAQGNADGEGHLGVMYRDGRAVPQDFRVADLMFLRAAQQHDLFGEDQLGDAYRLGRGVPINLALAAKYYQLAAEQGQPEAQVDLGYAYELGNGVAQDYEAEYQWSVIAEAVIKAHPDDATNQAAVDFQLSQIHAEAAAKHLSNREIYRAKAEAADWLLTHNFDSHLIDGLSLPNAPFSIAEILMAAIGGILVIYGVAKIVQVRSRL